MRRTSEVVIFLNIHMSVWVDFFRIRANLVCSFYVISRIYTFRWLDGGFCANFDKIISILFLKFHLFLII